MKKIYLIILILLTGNTFALTTSANKRETQVSSIGAKTSGIGTSSAVSTNSTAQSTTYKNPNIVTSSSDTMSSGGSLNLSGLSMVVNAFGWTFADGKYWIEAISVPQILKNGYFMVDKPKKGDVVLYYEKKILKHSATIKMFHNKLMAFSKKDNQNTPSITEINKTWEDADKLIYYRKNPLKK